MSGARHGTCPDWAWPRGAATSATVAADARDRRLRLRRFVSARILAQPRPPSLVSVIAPENVRSQAVARKLGATVDRRVVLAEHGPADLWLHPR